MPPQLSFLCTKSCKYWSSRQAFSFRLSCSTCSFVTLLDCRQTTRRKLRLPQRIRRFSNLPSQTAIEPQQQEPTTSKDSQTLKDTLLDLQKHFRSYVNLSRLQLALRGLEQKPGEETIRIAIIGLADEGRIPTIVKDLVRVLLADPLKDEEEWERALISEKDSNGALLLRIGESTLDNTNPGIHNRLAKELSISSPTLNLHRLEILVLGAGSIGDTDAGSEDLDTTILVPSIEIPTSSTGRYSPISTPVHKALVVGDGIRGAASLLRLRISSHRDIISFAVNFPGHSQAQSQDLPFQVTDIAVANAALKSLRTSLNNAVSYEHEWFKSGVPELLDWIKAETGNSPSGSRKAPIIWLIQSILTDATKRIASEESHRLSVLSSSKLSAGALASLRAGLEEWAERAHTELRDQLDIAFEGRRWRKLRWWKLFWRVDDVSMIGYDILNQRYLVEAEKEIVYLSGRMKGAGLFKARTLPTDGNWAYKPIAESSPTTGFVSPPPSLSYEDVIHTPQDEEVIIPKQQPWPLHIPISRTYLSMETVPALQALAQKLVIQTLTTSSLSTALASLIYVSTLSSTYFEVGGVAALGIVWSLQRMQQKWETAREFWEKEVREDGRKAVRAVEGIVNEALADQGKLSIEGAEELEQARKAVERAREAFERETRSVNR